MSGSPKTQSEPDTTPRPPVGLPAEPCAPDDDRSSPEALPARDELTRLLLAGVPVIVFAVDRNGVFVLIEGKGLESLGLQPGQLVGQSVLDAFGDVPQMGEYLRRALAGEPVPRPIEIDDIVFDHWEVPFRDTHGKIIGVAGIAVDATDRKKAEEELRAGQRLVQQMLARHEQERKLIAYEIHDGLVQDAVGAQMELEALLKPGELPAGPVRDRIARASELIGKSIAEARELIGGLRPLILDELGVVPAIEYLIEQRQRSKPSIEFTAEVQFDRLEPLLETTIHRIVQEAVTNADRHSRSDRLEIRLSQTENHIYIDVRDWGVGFDPTRVAEKRFGLQGIRERARLLRGRVMIDSAPGRGTWIHVDLPVVEAIEETSNTCSGSIE